MSTNEMKVPKSVGRQLNFAAGAANAVVRKLLEPHGLTLAQWAVLSAIWNNGALGIKEIATITGNEPPAASRIVDRMVSVGLLDRVTDPNDRRAVSVDLGEKAEDLSHLRTIYEEVNAVLLSDLSEAEVGQLFDLLGKVERSGRSWVACD